MQMVIVKAQTKVEQTRLVMDIFSFLRVPHNVSYEPHVISLSEYKSKR